MRHIYLFTLSIFFSFIYTFSFGQSHSIDEVDIALHSTEGLRFMTRDSSNAINIRFRMQNRVDLQTRSSDDLGLIADNGYIKRLRLRSAGYLMSKKLTYSLQLGFSPGDMDVTNSPVPQIIRDAIVFYRFSPKLRIGFGQTKLPGNRQRVISSGEQQFVDRSIVNATFNLDRDFGFQGYYKEDIGKFGLNLQGALSTGDGRNTTDRGTGLAYTFRSEFLPLGRFKMDGDYFEGDWAFEETPKLSIGGTASYNEDASRTGGQTGKDLFGKTDIRTFEGDALLKYSGWAFYTEYMNRRAAQPITTNPEEGIQFVYSGSGFNTQLSYQFRNHFEVGGRYSVITPDKKVEAIALQTKEYTIVGNYYYRWHRIKLQTDLTYQERENLTITNNDKNSWIWRFQVELGI